MGVHTSSSTSWFFYVSDVVVNHTQPSFMPPLIDTHSNCAVNFGDFWHGCIVKERVLCFGGLDEIGVCDYFGLSTAVIMICRGGELGVAYITQWFPVSFKCCHITAFSKKWIETSEGFLRKFR